MIRLLALLPLLVSSVAFADDPLRAVHTRATELAARGECAEALVAYDELARAGVEDPDVAYDRALCHAQLGELGRAIVWLERAMRLAPRDPEIREALARAEAKVRDARESEHHGEPLAPEATLFGTLTSGMPASTLTILALVFDVLAFAALGFLFVTRNERVRIGLGLVGSFSFVFLAAMLFGLGERLEWFEEGRLAVVVAPEVTLRAGPDERAPGRRIVREGDRLRVLGRRRDYAEVRLPDDQRGYVRADQIEILQPDGSD
ncbi:MAG: tetratricopeptide repeat protein [Myxococcales bacterium]|nr:tetratricopeptide repeat protein [Myxococcales bacterium]